ncbi:MAG: hypothetical protein KAG66_13350, partial [Methylococcales bacterium]|nr:hypothetical protein [Methylococcales bacterium]
MSTVKERLQILSMIEEGKISAGEAADLLRALDQSAKTEEAAPLKGTSRARWFRVLVSDSKTGRNSVDVNIPVSMVKVGIKMGAKFAPDIEGVDYDKIMEAVRGGKQGKIFDVYDSEDG